MGGDNAGSAGQSTNQADKTTENLLRGIEHPTNPADDDSSQSSLRDEFLGVTSLSVFTPQELKSMPSADSPKSGSGIVPRGWREFLAINLIAQVPGADPEVAKLQSDAARGNTTLQTEYQTLKTKGIGEEPLRKDLEKEVASRVKALHDLVGDGATDSKINGLDFNLLNSIEAQGAAHLGGNKLARELVVLQDVAKTLKVTNPDLASSLNPPALLSWAVRGSDIFNNQKLREEAKTALHMPAGASPQQIQDKFTEAGLKFLGGKDALPQLRGLIGQAFEGKFRRELKAQPNEAEQKRIAATFGLSPEDAKLLNEQYCLALKTMREEAAKRRVPGGTGSRTGGGASGDVEIKTGGGTGGGGTGGGGDLKPEPVVRTLPPGITLDQVKPDSINSKLLRGAPTDEIVGLSRKYDQAIYDALVDIVPKYWFWNTVKTFAPPEKGLFSNALKTADGKDRSWEDLEKIYRRFQKAYNNPLVAPDDERFLGKISRGIDNLTVPGAGPVVMTGGGIILTALGYNLLKSKTKEMRTDAAAAAGRVFRRYGPIADGEIDAHEYVKAIEATVGRTRGEDVTWEDLDEHLVLLEKRAPKERKESFSELRALAHIEARKPNSSTKEWLDKELSETKKGISEVAPRGGVAYRLSRAVNVATLGRLGRPADTSTPAPTTDASPDSTDTLSPEQKAEAAAQAKMEGIVANLLANGQQRGIPLNSIEGWSALGPYLDDKMVQETCIGDNPTPQLKKAWESFKAEMGKASAREAAKLAASTPGTIITPSEFLAHRLEPNGEQLELLRTEISKGSVPGLDLTSLGLKTQEAHEDAGRALRNYLKSDPRYVDAAGEITTKIINPLRKNGVADTDPAESVEDILNRETATPIRDIVVMQGRISSEDKRDMFETHYRRHYARDQADKGTIDSKDVGKLTELQKEIEAEMLKCLNVKNNALDFTGGFNKRTPEQKERYFALRSIRDDVADALTTDTNLQDRKTAAEQKGNTIIEAIKDNCLIDKAKPYKDPTNVDPAAKDLYKKQMGRLDKVDKAIKDIDNELAARKARRSQPKKGKPSDPEPSTADETRSAREALAEKVGKPKADYSVVQRGESGQFEVMRFGLGLDGAVATVEVINPRTGDPVKNSAGETTTLSPLEWRDRVAGVATSRDATEIKKLESADIKPMLTDLSRGLSPETVLQRAADRELAEGRKGKGSGLGRIALVRTVMTASATSVAGIASFLGSSSGAQAETVKQEEKPPVLEDGVMSKSSEAKPK